MNGFNNERYVLNFIAAINLDACGLPFMASALEEYLIGDLQHKINLLNGTGNYNVTAVAMSQPAAADVLAPMDRA
ncbi:MAG TPA: hypothetical protein VH280_23355 [Verrucomicrobiae bacterium]|jgi:hypothetical protein|nr:hypothetical protein [Verrucomicrobiae bacterium]